MITKITLQSVHASGLYARPTRNGLIVAGIVAVAFLLPPSFYAYLVWRQFGFLKLSGYMPYEELLQALVAGDIAGLFKTPLWSMNMTSGFLLSNMYGLTVGQLILTLAMGVAIALNVIAHVDLRRVCTARQAPGTATAAGSGLLATVGASSTGIMGCCGSGLGGGVLALAGIGANTANAIAGWSAPVQMAFIAGFVLQWIRLRRKLKTEPAV